MITKEEHIKNIALNAYYREKEIYSYQLNIDNYENILKSLPFGDIPESLSQYLNADITQIPETVPDADILKISEYQYRNKIKSLLRTEKIEQHKSKLVLDSLKSQILNENLDYGNLLNEIKLQENN